MPTHKEIWGCSVSCQVWQWCSHFYSPDFFLGWAYVSFQWMMRLEISIEQHGRNIWHSTFWKYGAC